MRALHIGAHVHGDEPLSGHVSQTTDGACLTIGAGGVEVDLFTSDPDWLLELAKTAGDLADDLRAVQAERGAAA